MHHPCDYTSYFNLITISQLNPSKGKVDRHKVFNTTCSKQPLYKEFTTYHGNHNIIGSMGKGQPAISVIRLSTIGTLD
jgi:hypothetical protein